MCDASLESGDPHDSEKLRKKSNVEKTREKNVIYSPGRHQLVSIFLFKKLTPEHT